MSERRWDVLDIRPCRTKWPATVLLKDFECYLSSGYLRHCFRLWNLLTCSYASKSLQFFLGTAVRLRFAFVSESDGMTTADLSLINHFLESCSELGAFHTSEPTSVEALVETESAVFRKCLNLIWICSAALLTHLTGCWSNTVGTEVSSIVARGVRHHIIVSLFRVCNVRSHCIKSPPIH